MTPSSHSLARCGIYGFFLVQAVSAQAETTSATMAISATVVETCSVAASPLSFRLANTPGLSATAQSTIALSCNSATGFEIALDPGANAAGDIRHMVDMASGAALEYEIYSDAARSSPWGNNAGVDTVAGAAEAGRDVVLTAYGSIVPSMVELAPGTYTDTIVVTVNF